MYCRATAKSCGTPQPAPKWAKSARPSPWLTTTGNALPAISAKISEGDLGTRTMPNRASNCSDSLRLNFAQWFACGMISARLLIIWQPLHTPRLNVSGRAKKAANISRSLALNKMIFAQPSPAPSTSP